MSEVAAAFVTLVPSAKGFGAATSKAIGGDLDRAGREGGKKYGSGFKLGLPAASALFAGILGGGVASFAKSAITLQADFGKTMSVLAATTGAPKAKIAELEKLAISLGASTTFSATEASGAMLELARQGLTPATIQGGALAGVLTLAAAGGTDLTTAATIAASALNVFKLKGSQVGDVAAALAAGANASAASVESLGAGLGVVGPGAVNAGLSLNETVAALTALSKAGTDSTVAGDSLKNFLIRLVPTTNTAKTAMKDLGLKFTDAKGQFKPLASIAGELQTKLAKLSPAQRSVALATIFGNDASAAANALATQGAKGITALVKATQDKTAAQKAADANTAGSAGALSQLSGAYETLQLSIGKALEPLTIFVATNIAGKLGAVGAAVSNFAAQFTAGAGAGGAFKAFLVTIKTDIASFASAVGPTIQRVGQAITGFVVGFATNTGNGGAFRGFLAGIVGDISNAAAAIGPTVKVIAGTIGDFIAGIVNGTGNGGAFRDFITGLIGDIRTAATTIAPDVQAIIGVIKDFFAGIQSNTGAGGAFVTTLRTIGDVVSAVSGFLADNAQAIITTAEIYGTAKIAMAAYSTVVGAVGFVQAALNKEIIFGTSIQKLATGAALGTRIQLGLLAIQQRAVAIATGLWSAATATGAAIQRVANLQTLANVAAMTVLAVRQAAGAVATLAFAAAQKVAGAAARIWAAGQWLVNAAMTANPIGLVIAAIVALVAIVVIAYKKNETFRNIVNAAWAGIKTAVSAVVNWFRANVPAAWEYVKAKTSAAWNAIKSATSTAWNAVKTIVSGVVAAFRFQMSIITGAIALVIRVVSTVGSAFSRAFSAAYNGVKSAIGSIVSTVGSVKSAVLGVFSSLGSSLYNAGAELIKSLIGGILSKISAVKDAIGSIASTVKDHLPGSPVKTGPLRSWNNGGAGRRLIEQGLVAGIDSQRSSVRDSMVQIARQAALPAQRFDSQITGSARAAGRPGTGGPLVQVGTVHVRDEDEMARRLIQRGQDAIAAYGLGGLAVA